MRSWWWIWAFALGAVGTSHAASVKELATPVVRAAWADHVALVYRAGPDPHRTVAHLVVGTGTHDAPEGQGHLPHLYEHLWFRVAHEGRTAWHWLTDHGCDVNATTYAWFTHYALACPAPAGEGLVALLAAQLATPLAGIGADAVRVEQRIISHELADRASWDTYVAAPWLADRLGVSNAPPPIHDPQAEVLDPAAMVAWYTAQAAPVALAVSGPLGADAVIGALAASLGPPDRRWDEVWTPTKLEKVTLPDPPAVLAEPGVLEGPVPHLEVWLAWALPGGAFRTFQGWVTPTRSGSINVSRRPPLSATSAPSSDA